VLSRLVSRPLFWLLALAVPFSWPLVWSLATPLPPRLPVLGPVPEFELVDQAGHPFGTRELRGKAWLAGFIFTRCPDQCPAITRKMAEIQGRTRQLEPAFHLVSISVDPGFDTPERLDRYARQYRASPRLWSFLTGPEPAIRETVVRGLKASFDRDGAAPGGISHDAHLVLVDAEGRVRAAYDTSEPDAVDRAVRDVGLLVNRGG